MCKCIPGREDNLHYFFSAFTIDKIEFQEGPNEISESFVYA